jgi:hypothetical protein
MFHISAYKFTNSVSFLDPPLSCSYDFSDLHKHVSPKFNACRVLSLECDETAKRMCSFVPHMLS